MSILAFALTLAVSSVDEGAHAQSPLQRDVDQVCTLIPAHYVYFDERAEHWDAACAMARQEAADAGDRYVLAVIEALLDELYDPHLGLNTNTARSPWLMPSGSEIRVREGDNGELVITDVRAGSGAEADGIRTGDFIVSINGQPPLAIAAQRMRTGDTSAPARRHWAVNAAVTGYRHEERRLEIRRGENRFTITLSGHQAQRPNTPVSSHHVDAETGLIRFNNSLGDDRTVEAFTTALDRLGAIETLILDLRDTPGGGNTSVAEPILGRFVEARLPYQRIEPADEAAWIRHVEPVSPYSDVSLIVLVGAWTGSMGEGMAIGLDAMDRADVIGPAMAGLAGGTESFHLPGGDLWIWVPTYNLAHLDGTPRHEWKPSRSRLDDAQE